MAPSMYTFQLTITDPDQGRFYSTRVHTARHYSESIERLYARVLAFAHAYREGVAFSKGLWEPDQPALWSHDLTGEISSWVEVGAPAAEKLQKMLRRCRNAECRVYFFEPRHVEQFVHSLRGLKPDFIERINFLQINPAFLSARAAHEQRNSNWSLTFSDPSVIGEIDGRYVETEIQRVELGDYLGRNGEHSGAI